jgi:hypothetical protein
MAPKLPFEMVYPAGVYREGTKGCGTAALEKYMGWFGMATVGAWDAVAVALGGLGKWYG